jgi:hypothetical protein
VLEQEQALVPGQVQAEEPVLGQALVLAPALVLA